MPVTAEDHAAARQLLVDAIAACPGGGAHAGCLTYFAGNPAVRQVVATTMAMARPAAAAAEQAQDQATVRTLLPRCAHGGEPCLICDRYRVRIVNALAQARASSKPQPKPMPTEWKAPLALDHVQEWKHFIGMGTEERWNDQAVLALINTIELLYQRLAYAEGKGG